MSVNSASIRLHAANDAENIVRQFLGEPNRRRSNKRELRWGTHGSFKLDLLTGKWHDFESGEHGDMADLVCREMQSDQRAAFEWLLRWLGEETAAPANDQRQSQLDADRVRREAEVQAKRKAKLAEAEGLWVAARPLLFSPAELYLTRRLSGRQTPHPAVRSSQLRFHPKPYSVILREGPVEGCIGAMLCRMIDPATGRFAGIQRVFLDRERQKIERKMLGGSGVVKLADRPHGDFGLCEGLENGLSVLDFFSWEGPLWAAMVAGNMSKFPVLCDVAGITIFADHDKRARHGPAGSRAAATCAARWREAGRKALLMMPPDEGSDWNSYLTEHRAEAPA